MDDLKSELAELKAFIAELKADRAKTKEKERAEAWTKYVSLTVVLVAVLASVATQRAGKYSSQVQINQVQASDQWNFYQALSIKQHLFEMTRHQITGTNAETLKLKKDFDDKIAGYVKNKEDIKAKAQALEAKRDAAQHLGSRMGPAVSCFTIAIAVCSICMISKKKPLWIVSILLSILGLLFWLGVVEKTLSKT